MIRRLHPLAGGLALLIILSFWSATVVSEAFGTPVAVRTVKTAILWGMLALIPALVSVGATGFRLGGRSTQPLVAAKRRRMPVIALNGLCLLLPSAIFLQSRAAAGLFDSSFMVVQGVELVAGALNITLLALSLRDGLRLATARRALQTA